MNTMESCDQYIYQWLNNRGIKQEVLEQYKVHCADNHIVIPVLDQSGKILFNKYRKDPRVELGPKYKYDKGSSSALYGIPSIANSKRVIICEGELDCLVLISNGYAAVSSTGGSGTFLREWVSLFTGKEVFICYDNDEAGFKGAYNVNHFIPWARIAWLPSKVGKGGDITDYFQLENSNFEAILNSATSWIIPPRETGDFEKKGQIDELVKEYKDYINNTLMPAGVELRSNYQSDTHVQLLVDVYLNRMTELKRKRYHLGKPKREYGNDILDAKQVPIDKYIEFNRQNFAPCIWHDEHTPSMYYYRKQNRVKCFGCDRMGDVMDVVQQLQGVDLQESIKIILNK